MDDEHGHSDDHDPQTVQLVTELQRVFLYTALGVSSLVYGSKVCPWEFSRCVKKGKGLFTAIAISVLLSPILAYVLTLAMDLDVTMSITLMVASCCPAGNLSPMFAYYTHSDVCMCLAVIVLSTLMAVGMIPLGMYICSSAYQELDLTVIPDRAIVATLFISMGCIALGMTFRTYKEKWADRFVRAFSWLPILVMLAMVIVVGVLLPHSLHSTPISIFTILLYLVIGLAASYLAGWLVGQDHDVCRSMAFCAANKSTMFTLTIVHASFSGEVLVASLPVPTFLLIEYSVIGVLLSVLYQIYDYYNMSAFGELLKNLKPEEPKV